MAKSAKAKKAKKADFAKVKFKVGKKLQKPQNETRTDFKARKIVLKEQLQLKTEQTLVTKKKHDIKELLSRLTHHSVFVRQDGVNGMREVIQKNEVSVLLPHLPTVLTGIAPCFFDTDSLIRSTVIKFIEGLLIKMGSSIEPYFNIIATHLSCAMVHLNTGVQADSLQLMKVLIKYTPALIARHANTLLKNFVNLISRKASSSDSSPKTTSESPVTKVNFSRLLHVEPNSTLSSHKWRVQLLQELSAFFEAILGEQNRIEAEIPYTTWQTCLAGSIPPLVCDDLVWSNTENLWLFSDPQQLEKFTLSIVPLLFEIWAEVDPRRADQKTVAGDALSEEAVETLSCIVKIIMNMWQITQICTKEHPLQSEWFLKQFKDKYMSSIMAGFPYSCLVTVGPKKKKSRRSGNQDVLQEAEAQNLKHCDDLNVSLALFALHMSSAKSFKEEAVTYFSKLLRDGNRDSNYDMNVVVKIIVDLLTIADSTQGESLVNAAHVCYVRLHPMKKDRTALLQILLTATDVDHRSLWGCKAIDLWVKQVTEDLVAGNVRQPLLEAAIILRLQDNTKINDLLSAKKDDIRERMENKKVPDLSQDQVKQKLKFLLKD